MTAPVRPRGVLIGPQLEALLYAANGFTSEQIAVKVGRSRDAVHLRLKYAAAQLGARSRTHAVAIAMARGLIKPGDIAAAARREAA